MPKIRKVPATLYLGPGKVIQIHLCSTAQLKEVCQEDPLASAGAWTYDDEHKRYEVFIHDQLSRTDQWTVLRHELRHALVDLDPY